jgi:transcriptional regulator with XRE-family HTH domain
VTLSRDVLARRIRDSIAEAGVTQQDVAKATGMDPTALSKALAGRREFKSLEVALIAEQLGLSTQWLLADDDEAPSPRALAARAALAERVAVDEALTITERIAELHELLDGLGYPNLVYLDVPLPDGSNDPVREGSDLASVAHSYLPVGGADLPPDLDDLASLIEDNMGVDVTFQPLPSGVDGLSLEADGMRLALVSSGVSATRQRFTLAHELGHLFAGDAHDLTVDEDVFGRRSREERRANSFAAAFLMPERVLRDALPTARPSEARIADLLGRLRVSLDTLAFRLHNLGIVNADGRDRVRAMSSARIALRPGRTADLQARNERRAPGLLLRRAVSAFVVGDLGVRPLATLLAVDPNDLLAELTPPARGRRTRVDEASYAL